MTPIVFGESEKGQKHLGSCSSIFNEKDGKENNVLKATIKDMQGAVGAESARENGGGGG